MYMNEMLAGLGIGALSVLMLLNVVSLNFIPIFVCAVLGSLFTGVWDFSEQKE